MMAGTARNRKPDAQKPCTAFWIPQSRTGMQSCLRISASLAEKSRINN